MFDRLLAFAEAHPEAFGLLCTLVVVPLLGSVASFADAWAAKRAPIATAFLRAMLPDLKRAAAVLAVRKLEEKKLPVPPEVRELSIRRVESAKAPKCVRCESAAPTAGKTMCRRCLELVGLGIFMLALTGCADLTYARSVRDAAHDAGETAAPLVDRWCVAQQAADLAEVRALPEHSPERERRAEQAVALQRSRRCREVVEAYDTVRVASITLDASVAAAESGQCMAARSPGCDVGGAAVKAATATAALATYMQHLQEASR